MKTPIRKRQFNTPVTDTDMKTPCRGRTITTQAMRTFTLSTTSKTHINNKSNHQTTENSDLANTRISLTKEFEAVSASPAMAKFPTGQNCTEQKTLISVTGVQPNRNTAMPLRVPLSFTASDNNTTVLSPAIFQCQNSLNQSSNCPPRRVTPHPKICSTNKPVEPECTSPDLDQNRFGSTTPSRESNDLNLSGILPLRETPVDKEQQKTSTTQVFVAKCYKTLRQVGVFHMPG